MRKLNQHKDKTMLIWVPQYGQWAIRRRGQYRAVYYTENPLTAVFYFKQLKSRELAK